MVPVLLLLIFAIAYFLGSFPAGYIAGKIRGVDIRKHGSGNIGATNALRVLGKPWGFVVFAVDALKGLVAVRVALFLTGRSPGSDQYADFVAIFAAAACVIGHSFPVWLGFKGGKGVATSAGAILGVMPLAAVAVLIVWMIVFANSRYVSLASIVAALALPIAIAVLMGFGMTRGPVLFYFSLPMTALVIWRHRSNITRLLSGTEPRFTRK